MALLRALLLVVATFAASCNALYTSTSPVKQLDEKNFSSEVLKSDGLWYIEFYAPWCGHCKNLTPEWEKAAEDLKGIVNVAAVDATENPSLAKKFGVQGYPTIKVFGADKRSPSDYNGGRTADAIVSDAVDEVRRLVKRRQGGKGSKAGKGGEGKPKAPLGGSPGRVQSLKEANFESAVINSSEPWIVAFVASWCGHCQKLKPEFSAAAKELKGVMNLASVDADANPALMQKYQIKGFPTIMVFGEDKQNPAPYNSERSKDAIVNFARSFGGGAPRQPSQAPEPPKPVEVVQLTSSDVFTDLCKGTGSQKLCLVAVLPHLAEGGAKAREQYLAQFKSAGDKMKTTLFTYLWSGAGAQSSLESTFGLTFGYPALIALSLEKKAYAVHVGSFNEDSVASFMSGLMAGSTRTAPFSAVPSIESIPTWDGQDYMPPAEEMSLDELFAEL